MADSKKRYKVGNTIFVEKPDGSLQEIKEDVSIADGPKPKFDAPKMPFRIPGKEKILNEQVPAELGTWEAASPSVPGSAVALNPANLRQNLGIAGSIAATLGTGGTASLPIAIGRSALGTMLGNMIGQGLESPQTPNAGILPAAEAGLEDAIGNTLFAGAGKAISRGINLATTPGKGIKDRIANAMLDSKLFQLRDSAGQVKDRYSPEFRAAIDAAPEIPMTVGMTTGKVLPEQVLTPELAAESRRVAQQANLKTLEPLLPTNPQNVTGAAGVTSTKEIKKALVEEEQKAYDKIFAIADSFEAPMLGKPISGNPRLDAFARSVLPAQKQPEVATMKGPILFGEVKDFANATLADLKESIKLTADSELLSGKVKNLMRSLEAFSSTGAAPFTEVRNAQATINKILRDRDSGLLPENSTRLLSELKSKLDTDVINSMDLTWPKGSSDAYRAAMAATKNRGDVITKSVNAAFKRGSNVPEDFYKNAFKNATTAKQFARVAGQKPAAEEFVRQFTDRFWNKLEGKFDGQNALSAWGKDSTSEVAKQLLTSEQRQAIEHFFRRAEVIDGNPSNIGVMALGMSEANAGIGSVRDLAGAVGNPMRLFSSNLLKLSAYIGAKQFSEKVLLNPAKAREAARLITIKRGRPGGESEARKFILGANLGEVLLKADNGEKVIYDTETGEATKID